MIRNLALVGHSHSGKTSLGEWMLYDEKVLTKQPLAGQSFLDSDPAEASRHSSVFSHFLRVPHNDHLFEIADTPWHDFQSDANSALDGSDAAVIVASVSDGLQPGTITSFQECQEKKIKSILCLSKMDRPFIDVDNFMDEFGATLGVKPVPLQVGIYGEGGEFEGVKPLFLLKSNGDIVKNDESGTEEAWMQLEEAVAMSDDDLLMEYLDDGALAPEKVLVGLKTAIRKQKILPCVYTSSEKNIGVLELMDSITEFLPNPVEAREDALQAACESEEGKCGMKPGVEAGFAARVVHTVVDSFGSLSILRVISNSCDGGGSFDSIPHNVVNMRTGEDLKIGLTAFTLQGKERLPFKQGEKVLPGNVIAIPKLESVQTNDILTVKEAVSEEAAEIKIEEATQVLTPLSRRAAEVPLMYTALVSLPDADGKKGGKGKSNSGSDKLISALHAISREDLAVKVDSVKGSLLLHCMSGDHAQLIASRVKDRYGIDIVLDTPPVQYKETISKAITNIEGRHKKQSGGSGQFGVCVINMEPLEEGSGVEFVSQIKGGVISKPFIASVEKGVREQLDLGGPLAGYPVTDVRVVLTDGKMHSVDSNDFAFTSAGKLSVKAALSKAGTRLLQPMEEVHFQVSEKLVGEITSIVSRNDGYVMGSESTGLDSVEIEAILPSASIPEVSDALRSKTAGSGTFNNVFAHYQAVSDEHTIKKIVDESPHRHE
jgi:elongation factor G